MFFFLLFSPNLTSFVLDIDGVSFTWRRLRCCCAVWALQVKCSKIGCRRTHFFRGQARKSYLQAAFLTTCIADDKLSKSQNRTEQDCPKKRLFLGPAGTFLCLRAGAFFSHVFFGVRSYSMDFWTPVFWLIEVSCLHTVILQIFGALKFR